MIAASCGSEPTASETTGSISASTVTPENINEAQTTVNEADMSASNDVKEMQDEVTSTIEEEKKQHEDTKKMVNKEVVENMVEKTNNIAEEIPTPVKEVVEEIVAPVSTYNFHAYESFNNLLKTYVTYAGKVNYKGIKAKRSDLDAIVKEFQENVPGSGWSSKQKLTYWINAYNVFTIKLIVDNYPTTSITKITAKPWDKKFIQLGGKTYSLNNIENDIIRGRFNEPRIHFAVNCASESCPVLLNKAFTPANLYPLLTSQTKRFLKDTSKNNFDGKEIKISKIFDWYKVDFTKNGATVIDFINKYRTTQLDDPKIGYLEYSWELND